MARPRRKKPQKKLLVILLCITLVLLTAATGVLAVVQQKGGLPIFDKLQAEKPASSSSESAQVEEEAPQTVPQKRFPEELRAVTIKPGVDFKLSGKAEKISAQIDSAIQSAIDLTMNAVVLDTLSTEGKVIYQSTFLPYSVIEGFDPLAYAIEKAREAGLYVYTTYYVTDVSFSEDKPEVLGRATSALIEGVTTDIRQFASSYQPDGVMVDSYYNVQSKRSYANYLALGGGVGYEDYMHAVPEALVTLVKQALDKAAPGVAVGLISEAVWANDYEDEQGSATKASFSALIDGNADTLRFLENGLADFVVVKAYGSIDDTKLPYLSVASWWGERADDIGTPLYIMHAADKAATDEVGWSEYDQLARQVIEARTMPGYQGSIFNSLSRLIENPKDCATKLVGYFEGSVKAEHIMQDLELTKPAKTTFTSFDPTVMFAGNTDPNTDATINGVAIKTDENGYFQLEMPLTEGANVFKINHKGKTVAYNITRITEVVKEVSPGSGTINVDGATKLTIDAVAYAQAKVYAVIGGTTVMLKQSDQQDDAYRDTNYARFSGVYTVPDAKADEQNLGAVTVYGEWNGLTKNKSGARIIVNKRMLPSDGTPVVVVADIAETFRGDTVSQYSEATYFPLPKGALDYAVGEELTYTFTNNNKLETHRFFRLQSGLRVFSDDIMPVSTSAAAVANRISACTVTSDARYTKVILATRQQVSYNAVYAQDKITFRFNYTNSLPDSMKLSKNPLFSAVNFSGDTMTLVLKGNNKLMGMYPYYDNDGNLVLRFNNPPAGGISGAKIVIDPGHGGNDVGALGYLSSHPERVVNYNITARLVNILKSRGATVLVTNDNQYTYKSLEQRTAGTAAADPHIFVSVHSNSSAYNTAAVGTEAYYFNYWSTGLAQYVSANVASALNTVNRGQKFGYYYVTRTMQYPAILLEAGFMSNQNEYHKLINDAYQSNVATAIANGISAYLNYMGSGGSLTGTESTGGTVSDAGKNASAHANLSNNGTGSSQGSQSSAQDSSQSEDAVYFYFDQAEIVLAPGNKAELVALWDTDDEFDVEWSATGDGAAADLAAMKETLSVHAKVKGEMIIVATVKGHPELKAECKLVVK